jgi:hypothetical protein
MADQSIIDKAIGLIPGVGKPKRVRKRASPQMQIAALQKGLAALTRDVEKLSRLIGSKQKQPAKGAASSRQKSQGGSRAKAKRPKRPRSAPTERTR